MMKKIVSIMMMAACCLALHAQDIEGFVTGLMEQYPKAHLLDIYKSCFQDFMGAEHLVNDPTSAKAYLDQELATTDISTLQPWYYEPCGPGGNYVRVSLRAVLEGKITAEQLLNAFVRSANASERPTVASWADRWHAILTVVENLAIDLPNYQEEKMFIDEEVLAQGKYAISHSADYRETYAPHYRIIKRDIFEQEIKPLLGGCCCLDK